MSIISIGTDLHRVGRFGLILSRHGLYSPHVGRLARKVLHLEKELPQFEAARQSNQLDLCVRTLAHSWCVKEAVYKTLDTADQTNFAMRDWYKFSYPNGRPGVQSDNYNKNEEFLLSISHDGDYVTSTVLRKLLTN